MLCPLYVHLCLCVLLVLTLWFFPDQPTYYHFHIHIVHVSLEAGATQAVGKALSLDNIISQLATMAGDDEAGMDKVDLSFTLGEASELWTQVFLPLKEKRLQ